MRVREDDRAVSNVLGVVFLLGFAVILLSIYQTTIVSSENKQVEFDHSRTVQNDMLDLRNALLRADTTGEKTYATVTLGTDYPPRLIAINPPPASGSLRTGDAANITVTDTNGNSVSNLCPSGGAIETRTLRYSPGYHEYRNPPTIVYENTVLYLKFNDGKILMTDENLIEGGTINITPLNTSFAESGVEKISVEPVPGIIKTSEVDGANVTLPTQLSESRWEDLLSGDVDPANVTVRNGNLSINQSEEVAVRCAPLGLNENPPGGARTGGGISINPAGPNDVEIRNFSRPSQDFVEITFNNTANSDTNITDARISFYNNPTRTGGGGVGPLELINPNNTVVATLEVLGPEVTVDPEIHFPGNETERTLTVKNEGGEKMAQDDFFVLEVTFSNGREGTYFVDVPKD